MDLELEIVKLDLPSEVRTLSCKVGTQGNEKSEANTCSVDSSVPNKHTFGYHFDNRAQHVMIMFTASASESSQEEVGRCFYPMTFNGRLKRALFKSLIPSELGQRTLTAYLYTSILHMNTERVVGRLWFKIRDRNSDKQSPTTSSPESPYSLSLEPSRQTVQKIAELKSNEKASSCISTVPGKKPVVHVLFHSVTTLKSDLTPASVIPIACIGTTLNIREDSLFNEGSGPIHTLPTLKPVTLEFDDDMDVLELHVAEKSSTGTPFFSASCPLIDLVPFKHYNWEYNWRWLPGKKGFSPAHSQGNLEQNVSVSIVYWPSTTDHLSHEGLELFVESVECSGSGSANKVKDVVLCCELVDIDTEFSRPNSHADPPYLHRGQGDEDRDITNFNIAAMQYSTNDRHQSVPAYFFFPSYSQMSQHKLALSLYTSTHNVNLWWCTDVIASASVRISDAMMRALQDPSNRNGARWELTESEIFHFSEDSVVVRKLSGGIRWKHRDSQFLSKEMTSSLGELPLFGDLASSREVVDGVLNLADIYNNTDSEADAMSDEEGEEDLNARLREMVNKLGKDIHILREENRILKKENSSYEKYVLDMEVSVIVTAENEKSLHPLTKSDLIHRVVTLSERLKKELEIKGSLQGKVQHLENVLTKKDDKEAYFVELQAVNIDQKKLIRGLQTKLNKYKAKKDKYKMSAETFKKQEEMMNQMESVIASQKLELEALRSRNNVQCPSDCCNKKNSVVEEMKTKLEMSIAREKAVMEELRANVALWAREKARYEMDIANLRELRASNSNGTYVISSHFPPQQVPADPSCPQHHAFQPSMQHYPHHISASRAFNQQHHSSSPIFFDHFPTVSREHSNLTSSVSQQGQHKHHTTAPAAQTSPETTHSTWPIQHHSLPPPAQSAIQHQQHSPPHSSRSHTDGHRANISHHHDHTHRSSQSLIEHRANVSDLHLHTHRSWSLTEQHRPHISDHHRRHHHTRDLSHTSTSDHHHHNPTHTQHSSHSLITDHSSSRTPEVPASRTSGRQHRLSQSSPAPPSASNNQHITYF